MSLTEYPQVIRGGGASEPAARGNDRLWAAWWRGFANGALLGAFGVLLLIIVVEVIG